MCNLLPRVRSFNKVAAECESSASGSSASAVLLNFWKTLHSENISQEQAYGLKSEVKMCAWSTVVYKLHANSYLISNFWISTQLVN